MCGSLQVLSSSSATVAQSSRFSDQVSWLAFFESLHWVLLMWKLWYALFLALPAQTSHYCPWVPFAHPEWKNFGIWSPSGCSLELKHSAMSRAALSCCFAAWSVVGLEITNLYPVPPLGTILCPSKEGSTKAECACVRATPRLLWLTGSSGQWSFQDLISQWIYNLPSLLMPRRHFIVFCGWAGRSHAKNHSLCLSLKIKEDLTQLM